GPNGNRIWVARYDSRSHGEDDGFALTVDGAGNVYVTGPSYGGASASFDYITLKYDSSGTQLWEARYNGPGSGVDIPYHIAVDNAGSVYVTGYSYGGGATTKDYATLKYSSNGIPIWAAP